MDFKKRFWRSVVILGFASITMAQEMGTSDIAQCTQNPGELPLNVNVHGCVTPPCALPQLQDVVMDVIFKAPRFLPIMRTLANAYLRIGLVTLPVPYPLGDNAVTCNFLTNSYCPVLQGEVIIYQLRLFIEPTFAVGTNADIEFRVVDDDGPVFCFRTAISIIPPVTKIKNITNIISMNDFNLSK